MKKKNKVVLIIVIAIISCVFVGGGIWVAWNLVGSNDNMLYDTAKRYKPSASILTEKDAEEAYSKLIYTGEMEPEEKDNILKTDSLYRYLVSQSRDESVTIEDLPKKTFEYSDREESFSYDMDMDGLVDVVRYYISDYEYLGDNRVSVETNEDGSSTYNIKTARKNMYAKVMLLYNDIEKDELPSEVHIYQTQTNELANNTNAVFPYYIGKVVQIIAQKYGASKEEAEDLATSFEIDESSQKEGTIGRATYSYKAKKYPKIVRRFLSVQNDYYLTFKLDK